VLGGLSLAMAADVAETTMIPRPPRGREAAPVQISRLLEAHEMVILAARSQAKKIDDMGDLGSADILVSQVLRTNELQAWFLSEHLVNTSPTEA
jgi:starvation-inducible DNA-binding protein